MSMEREIALDELKRIQIEILDEVHAYCEKNHLTYFLSSGTLIGAVRHKGYIPWDDDIDIYMPRNDYEEFLDSFNESEKEYRVFSLKTDSSCTLAYAKVERVGTRIIETLVNPRTVGVNIDVFPLDGVPDDLAKRRVYFSKIQRIRNAMVLKDVSVDFKKRGLVKNLILIVGRFALCFKSMRRLAVELDSMVDKHCPETEFVCNLIMGNGIQSVFSRDAVRDVTDVEFEGKRYKTMLGYKEYLTRTYGDYMQLPPVEKRVSTHVFHAYWI